MKVALLSDLHLEFPTSKGWEALGAYDPEVVDVLVIAGDLDSHLNLKQTLSELCQTFKHVLYVEGNHEYYGSTPAAVRHTLREIQAELGRTYGNFHWLHRTTVTIEGKTFAGTPLWFPQLPDNVFYQRLLNDFSQVRDYTPWVYEENSKDQDFICSALSARVDVIITHYLPHSASTPARFKDSQLNRFFICDMSQYMGQKVVWCHGHTHDACEYYVGDTRVLCNPCGYGFSGDGTGSRKGFMFEV